MGTQKTKWRRKHSPKSHHPRGYARQLAQSIGLKQSRRPLRKDQKTAKEILTERIYTIACGDGLDFERCEKVSTILSLRLNTPRATMPLGKIKDSEIPIRYVKPKDYNGDLAVGTDFYVTLSPYHGLHYVVMLKGEGMSPAILIIIKENLLAGAVNFLSVKHPLLGYPSYLYDPQKIGSLFNIECIKPFEPSPNYKEI